LTCPIVCRAIQCELDLNKASDDIKSLRDEIHQLKLERMQFEESVEKDRTEKESAFENERREHQQMIQQMTVQEKAMIVQIVEANRDIQDLKVENEKLTRERDDMQDKYVFFKKLKMYISYLLRAYYVAI